MPNKALFLDMDGTLIDYVPYLKNAKDVALNKMIVNQIKIAKRKRYLLIVIQNQAGIEKGKITMDEFNMVRKKIYALLKEKGIKLDGHYACFSPDDKNFSRKPNPGMILLAKDEFDLDLKQCILVGDRAEIDLEAGRRVGIPRLYLIKDFYGAKI
jgi:D-glycero-D-manno-heptose 1,7-bisphosphate phosphatase